VIAFGAVHFCRLNLRERPDVAIRALAELNVAARSSPGTFQGMLAGTDKFTRLTKITDNAKVQLAVDLRAGVYSSLLAFWGSRNQPDASLSLDAGIAAENAEVLQAVQYTTNCSDPTDVERAEQVSIRLWSLLNPTYGFSVLGASDTAVQQELSGVPIRAWNAPRNEREENRLTRLQAARPLLGRFVRGAAWGTFLGHPLVARLGGLEAVRQRAPVYAVQELETGGAYLRLTQAPLLLGTPEYEGAAVRLEEFLEPVMPDMLKELA